MAPSLLIRESFTTETYHPAPGLPRDPAIAAPTPMDTNTSAPETAGCRYHARGRDSHTGASHSNNGRGDRIRTCDPLLPKTVTISRTFKINALRRSLSRKLPSLGDAYYLKSSRRFTAFRNLLGHFYD